MILKKSRHPVFIIINSDTRYALTATRSTQWLYFIQTTGLICIKWLINEVTTKLCSFLLFNRAWCKWILVHTNRYTHTTSFYFA